MRCRFLFLHLILATLLAGALQAANPHAPGLPDDHQDQLERARTQPTEVLGNHSNSPPAGDWQALVEAIAYHYAGEFERSRITLDRLIPVLDRHHEAAMLVIAHRFLGQNHYRLGAMERALAATLTARDIAADAGMAEQLGHIGNLLGAIHIRTGQPDQALQELLTALEIFRTQDRTGDVAKLHNTLAVLYIELDQLEDAETHLTASIQISERLGRMTTLISNFVNLAELRTAQGRIPEAIAALDRCMNATASPDTAGTSRLLPYGGERGLSGTRRPGSSD